MAADSPLDQFKSVLTGATRALANEPEVELAFTADAPSQSGRHVKVPMPGRNLPSEQVAEARGFADGFALRMRLHDAALHQKRAPKEAVARAVFDAVETARVEALGSRGYAGIAGNLDHALQMRMRSDPISRARSRDEVPLSTAIQLMVRERLTGRESPAEAALGLALVRDWIEDKGGDDLDALALAIDDQAAFAKLVGNLLEDLDLTEGELIPDEADEGGGEDEGTDEQQQDEGEEGEQDGETGEGEVEARGEQNEAETEDGQESEQEQGEFDDAEGEPGDDGEEGKIGRAHV